MPPLKKKRTKRDYTKLFDDPSHIFETCEVTLFPYGQPEIWIKPKGKRGVGGVKIRCGTGPFGMRVEVSSFTGTDDLVVMPLGKTVIPAESAWTELIQFFHTPEAKEKKARILSK